MKIRWIVFLLLAPVVSAACDYCSESGCSNYIICENWDVGSPPVSPWPCEDGPSWHGWMPSDYGGGPCSNIVSEQSHSGPNSFKAIKNVGKKDAQDITHSVGGLTKIYTRFYIYIPSQYAQEMIDSSFIHFIFINDRSSAESSLDFRKRTADTCSPNCDGPTGPYGEDGGYEWKEHLMLATHAYDNSPDYYVETEGYPFFFEDNTDRWVLVEWMVDFSADRTTLWIDEVPIILNALYITPYSSANSVTLSNYGGNTINSYRYYVDDFVVSTSYIGPRGGSPPLAVCGNGAVESGETCDDGNTVTEACVYGQTSCAVCSSGCQSVSGATRYCGDSFVNSPYETCDDGNLISNDGCSSICQVETLGPVCGNGAVESGETCDDGNIITETCSYGQQSCTVCSSGCQNVAGATSYCDDGVCDSGNENCNSCSGDCECVVIGDKYILGESSRSNLTGAVQDTYLTIDTNNHFSENVLKVYAWPDNEAANNIIIKWDLSGVESNIGEAKLNLYFNSFEGSGGQGNVDLGVHRIINHDPVINLVNGVNFDGVNPWTANSMRGDGIAMGLEDVALAEDVVSVNMTNGYKTFDVTEMVNYWISNPSENYGMLISLHGNVAADTNRFFASSENVNPALRPELELIANVLCVPVHEADNQICGDGISLDEITAYFDLWLSGEKMINDLLVAVGIWKG